MNFDMNSKLENKTRNKSFSKCRMKRRKDKPSIDEKKPTCRKKWRRWNKKSYELSLKDGLRLKLVRKNMIDSIKKIQC